MAEDTGNRRVRANSAALGLTVLINIAAAWYPFTLDLPRRVVNTAARLSDGTWQLDRSSRVRGCAPPEAAAAAMDVPWQIPVSFWVWPERLYIPSNDAVHERMATAFHIASFVPLSYFMGPVADALAATRMLAIAFVFSVILNGGKLLASGRHPSIADVLLNLVEMVLGFFVYRCFAAQGGVMTRQK